ncbi:MAG: GHKL domain-containing protein, partial [Clostridia bacterium]|nr:GHKL domain-containing protein [Clostridia bacterium]
RAPAAARNLGFRLSVEENVSSNGSPDAIRQLVSTLLENAVKYSPDGGQIDVELTTHRKTAVLSVENATVQPINEKELPRLFDRFYRSDVSRNSATGGHGIGLSIAKAIVAAHGGTIVASTKTGSDFRITVTLLL